MLWSGRSRPRLRRVSLAASWLWLVAAAGAVAIADFPSDRLWGGGLTGLVAVVTGALALAVRPDEESATTIKRTRPGDRRIAAMTSTAADTFARFVDVLVDSLDDHAADGEALASRVHLSRFHFDRLVSAAAG